jgi:uncharacterized phage protein (TIGR02220 family)
MRKELTEVVRSNTIPTVVGGRDCLCMTEAQVGHLISDLEKLFKELSKPESSSELEEKVDRVFDYINQAWDHKYKKSTEANRKPIRARLREGHSIDDLCAVAQYLGRKWGPDPRMVPYLRPITVFSPSKFEGYLQATKKHQF